MTTQNVVQRRSYSFYQRLFFLYVLNLSDWFCTQALLGTGRFYEANPLMNLVLRGFLPTLLVKGVLPLALSVLCAVLFKLSGLEEIRFGNILLDIGIVVYAAVNLWHIVNFLLLLSAI